jgi:hypothetical protein
MQQRYAGTMAEMAAVARARGVRVKGARGVRVKETRVATGRARAHRSLAAASPPPRSRQGECLHFALASVQPLPHAVADSVTARAAGRPPGLPPPTQPQQHPPSTGPPPAPTSRRFRASSGGSVQGPRSGESSRRAKNF